MKIFILIFASLIFFNHPVHAETKSNTNRIPSNVPKVEIKKPSNQPGTTTNKPAIGLSPISPESPDSSGSGGEGSGGSGGDPGQEIKINKGKFYAVLHLYPREEEACLNPNAADHSFVNTQGFQLLQSEFDYFGCNIYGNLPVHEMKSAFVPFGAGVCTWKISEAPQVGCMSDVLSKATSYTKTTQDKQITDCIATSCNFIWVVEGDQGLEYYAGKILNLDQGGN